MATSIWHWPCHRLLTSRNVTLREVNNLWLCHAIPLANLERWTKIMIASCIWLVLHNCVGFEFSCSSNMNVIATLCE